MKWLEPHLPVAAVVFVVGDEDGERLFAGHPGVMRALGGLDGGRYFGSGTWSG